MIAFGTRNVIGVALLSSLLLAESSEACDPPANVAAGPDLNLAALVQVIEDELGSTAVKSWSKNARSGGTTHHFRLSPASLKKIHSFLQRLEKTQRGLVVRSLNLNRLESEGEPRWKCSFDVTTVARPDPRKPLPMSVMVWKVLNALSTVDGAELGSLSLASPRFSRSTSHATVRVADFGQGVRLSAILQLALSDYELDTSFNMKKKLGELAVSFRPLQPAPKAAAKKVERL